MDLLRVQNRVLYITLSIRDVLNKHEVPCILAYGTLLGASLGMTILTFLFLMTFMTALS